MAGKAEAIEVGGVHIAPGTRHGVELALPELYTHTPLTMPVHVVHGRAPGPRLFVCAAVHGDELNGVEVIRRLLSLRALERLRGTLFAVPVVNVYGFLGHSRYLPDRRDLNRSFPGAERGSLAARIAALFMREIVARCGYGIDLHTGSAQRANLPQIRALLDDERTMSLARAFGVPVIVHADLRDGSLRAAAGERGVKMLLYEGGEAMRFDELAIRAGTQGVVNVMRMLGMLAAPRRTVAPAPFIARGSTWVRAPESGIVHLRARLGARVAQGEALATLVDVFGEEQIPVLSSADGVVIGRSHLPLVHAGEALYHIARFEDAAAVADSIEAFSPAGASDPGLDTD